jgi:hypothetical protein
MFPNFKFSGSYSECKAVQSSVMCCHSNTTSAVVLLEQQSATARVMDSTLGDTGGR